MNQFNRLYEISDDPGDSAEELDYWHNLIDEHAAAAFLGLSVRTLQGFRQRGNSPVFIKISARCVRYRRIDLRAWSDGLQRHSTSACTVSI